LSRITLPASDTGFFSSDRTYNTSDITLSSSLGDWNDSVGRAMRTGAERIAREFNTAARNIWKNVERLSKIKPEVPKYESCRQMILNISAKLG